MKRLPSDRPHKGKGGEGMKCAIQASGACGDCRHGVFVLEQFSYEDEPTYANKGVCFRGGKRVAVAVDDGCKHFKEPAKPRRKPKEVSR